MEDSKQDQPEEAVEVRTEEVVELKVEEEKEVVVEEDEPTTGWACTDLDLCSSLKAVQVPDFMGGWKSVQIVETPTGTVKRFEI